MLINMTGPRDDGSIELHGGIKAREVRHFAITRLNYPQEVCYESIVLSRQSDTLG